MLVWGCYNGLRKFIYAFFFRSVAHAQIETTRRLIIACHKTSQFATTSQYFQASLWGLLRPLILTVAFQYCLLGHNELWFFATYVVCDVSRHDRTGLHHECVGGRMWGTLRHICCNFLGKWSNGTRLPNIFLMSIYFLFIRYGSSSKYRGVNILFRIIPNLS